MKKAAEYTLLNSKSIVTENGIKYTDKALTIQYRDT